MTVRMEWHGDEVAAELEEAAARGIAESVEHLKGVSADLAPHEEGILAATATASTDGLTGAVSFDTPYAVRQHEELTWHHDPGKQAKYLEQPWLEERPAMLAMIAARMRRAMRGG